MSRAIVDICPKCNEREKGYFPGGKKRGYCRECYAEIAKIYQRKRMGHIPREERFPEAAEGICARCKDAPREIKSYCRDCNGIMKRGKAPRFKRNFWKNPIYGKISSDKKTQARKRGIEFSLSQQEFQDLIESDCFYCGSPPNNESKGATYQGIDRIDSSKGYIPGNVVPCCKMCNWGKNILSQQEFFDHILKIVEHQGLL